MNHPTGDALDELRHHWGEAYAITHPEPDVWLAQRRDNREILRAGNPNSRRDMIIKDYSARPVRRDCR